MTSEVSAVVLPRQPDDSDSLPDEGRSQGVGRLDPGPAAAATSPHLLGFVADDGWIVEYDPATGVVRASTTTDRAIHLPTIVWFEE